MKPPPRLSSANRPERPATRRRDSGESGAGGDAPAARHAEHRSETDDGGSGGRGSQRAEPGGTQDGRADQGAAPAEPLAQAGDHGDPDGIAREPRSDDPTHESWVVTERGEVQPERDAGESDDEGPDAAGGVQERPTRGCHAAAI